MPGAAAFALGFAWPFYEYLKGGYVFYHPGIVWDKDFTEYFHWYFKHKIYKKKYWNLDAYLYAYYGSHNEHLASFYETQEYFPGEGNNDKGGYQGTEKKEDGYKTKDKGVADRVDPDRMELILSQLMEDMIENNPHLQKFIEEMTGPESYERLKKVVRQVMDEEFGGVSADKRVGQGLPVFEGE